MSTMNIFDMSDLWNDGATTFSAIRMNVTDTASASGSLLMDLQVGGVSRFRFRKDGVSFFAGEVYLQNSAQTQNYVLLNSQGVALTSASKLSWGNTSTNINNPDTILTRDAANTLAQRNGVNAQAFRVYNTFTDASNYERGKMEWASNVLRIGTEKAGTGTARALELQTDGVTRLTLAASGATFSGEVNVGASNVLGWGADRARLFAPTASVIRILPTSGDARLNLGGDTSSFPALKRSTTSLQARLADDSAFTNIQGKLTTETAYTAGAPTATGYIVLYDSTGGGR